MIPKREASRQIAQTYFVTSATWGRRALFQARPYAELFLAVLEQYRGSSFMLHEYVLMPDHFHLLISPSEALERSVQKIKGGFSFRLKKELEAGTEIWQRGFSDHRIRDDRDYLRHREYILANPVRAGLCMKAEEYEFSSAVRCLDAVPQRLKPQESSGSVRHG